MNLLNAFKECLSHKEDFIHVENDGDFFMEREGKTLKIFFEWSDDKEDWRNNFKFLAIPCKPYKDMSDIWFCHRGFFNVFKAILPYIVAAILDPEIERIEIVGYSHGAALAMLCYEYAKFNRPEIEVEGVGFGCPRVFWGIVPKALKERVKDFKAVRNGNDIVTHVPPVIFGYRHITELVKIGQTNPIKDHYSKKYLFNLTEDK